MYTKGTKPLREQTELKLGDLPAHHATLEKKKMHLTKDKEESRWVHVNDRKKDGLGEERKSKR